MIKPKLSVRTWKPIISCHQLSKNKSGQKNQSGQNLKVDRTGLVRSGQVRTGLDRSGQVGTGRDMSGQLGTGQDR